MKRFPFYCLSLVLSTAVGLSADENVRAAQEKLKQNSYYIGEANGNYDIETTAAVTRFQIRNGLQITGRIDAATAEALGIPAGKADVPPTAPESEAWRRLRQSDEQFLERLNAGEIPPPRVRTVPVPMEPVSGDQSEVPEPTPSGTAPAAPTPSNPAALKSMPSYPANRSADALGRERLRDYVAAFVLAGLDPHIGAELEFFGEQVDYFGERSVSREKIRRDLVRYDQRWPERHFWLAGELQVEPQADGQVKVTFPLRFELRHGKARSSGEIQKTLLLEHAGADLQIVGVNERKRQAARP